MLKVTVELIPHGFGEPEVLGVMKLVNDGKETRTTEGKSGSYDVTFTSRQGKSGGVPMPGRTCRVEHWNRVQVSIWNLVKKALEEAGY